MRLRFALDGGLERSRNLEPLLVIMRMLYLNFLAIEAAWIYGRD